MGRALTAGSRVLPCGGLCLQAEAPHSVCSAGVLARGQGVMLSEYCHLPHAQREVTCPGHSMSVTGLGEAFQGQIKCSLHPGSLDSAHWLGGTSPS